MSVNGGLGKYYSLAYLKVKITHSKLFQGEDFLAGGSTYLLEEEVIPLTTLYHFHPLHKHLDISWAIISESSPLQFVIFNPLSYCFEGTIGFDVKTSFVSRPMSRIIR